MRFLSLALLASLAVSVLPAASAQWLPAGQFAQPNVVAPAGFSVVQSTQDGFAPVINQPQGIPAGFQLRNVAFQAADPNAPFVPQEFRAETPGTSNLMFAWAPNAPAEQASGSSAIFRSVRNRQSAINSQARQAVQQVMLANLLLEKEAQEAAQQFNQRKDEDAALEAIRKADKLAAEQLAKQERELTQGPCHFGTQCWKDKQNSRSSGASVMSSLDADQESSEESSEQSNEEFSEENVDESAEESDLDSAEAEEIDQQMQEEFSENEENENESELDSAAQESQPQPEPETETAASSDSPVRVRVSIRVSDRSPRSSRIQRKFARLLRN